MVLDKAINLKRYAQSCWGLATREWHFIEPVTKGIYGSQLRIFYFMRTMYPVRTPVPTSRKANSGHPPVTGYPVSVFIC